MAERAISVCHLIHSLENGGAQNLLLELADVDDGAVEYSLCYRTESENSLRREFERRGFVPTILPESIPFDPRAVAHLRAFVERNDVDVIHAHLPYQQILARVCGLVTDIAVVSTHHNLGNTPHPLVLGLERFTRRLDSATVGVSRNVREAHQTALLDRDHDWNVVHNGIDVDSWNESVTQADTADNGGVTFLNVGRYIPEKRQIELIRAMDDVVDDHPASELSIVGWGPEEDRMRDLVADLDLGDAVDVAGYVENPEPYYAEADVYVTCSPAEGHPITLVEAMAAGLPVVSVDYDGVEEVVVDGETGIVVPHGDRGALVNAMEAVQDDSWRTKLGDDAYDRAREVFEAERTHERYVDLYRRVVTSDG